MKNITCFSAEKYALIDLHLHLDGSLSLSTVKRLAAMQNIPLPKDDEELMGRLQVSTTCKDLNEYLQKFAFPVSLLCTEDAVSEAFYLLAEELKEQGLVYAEIRFAPQNHTGMGLTQEQVTEAAIRGLKRSTFRAGIILCCMRGIENHDQNVETVMTAKKYLGKGVCAVDLAGAEALFPTESFSDLFALASQEGIPYTIHAGEASGPESVRQALLLGAKRIGHGVRTLEDPSATRALASSEAVLELCPTSNLNTCIFSDISEYPIMRFLDEGIAVTVNTDNMTVSGVSLKSEFQKLMDTFPLSESQLEEMVYNAASASFADEETKAWIRSEIGKRLL